MRQRISNWKKRLQRERVYNEMLDSTGLGVFDTLMKSIANKNFPVVIDGVSNPLICPFEFNRNFTLITPNASNTLTKIGNSVTSVGTISHPAASDAYGHMANFATGETINNTAGTGNSATMWVRGETPFGLSGFLFYARIAFPNNDYNSVGAILTIDVQPTDDWEADDVITGQTSGETSEIVEKLTDTTYKVKNLSGTYTLDEEIGVTGDANKLANQGASHPTTHNDGSRIFVGLTSGTMASTVASDDPAGSLLGFQRISEEGGIGTHVNWQFIGKDGTDIEYNDTGLVFTPERPYEFYIYAKPMYDEVHYYVRDLFLGSIGQGSINTYLPAAAITLRSGFQIQTIDAVNRSARMGLLYTSTLK